MEALTENIRLIRKSKGWSQAETAERLGIKHATYSKIERKDINLTVDRFEELCILFGLKPEEVWYYHQRVDEPSERRDLTRNKDNIRFVPIHAQAGFLSGFGEQLKDSDFIEFSIPSFSDEGLYMIRIEGDSMAPTIPNGAFIIVREVQDRMNIKWGEPYVVVTHDGRVAKRVLKSKDKEKVILFSENETLYQPYEIRRSDIISMWQIKGLVSEYLPSMK